MCRHTGIHQILSCHGQLLLVPPISSIRCFLSQDPDLARFGRRLSRSSLSLPLSQSFSHSSVSSHSFMPRSASPFLQESKDSTPQLSRPVSVDYSPQCSGPNSNRSSQRDSLGSSPSSKPASPCHTSSTEWCPTPLGPNLPETELGYQPEETATPARKLEALC